MTSILITGVTSGIGAEVLKHCLNANWDVSVIVRTDHQKQKLQKDNPTVQFFVAELSKREEVKHIAQQLASKQFDYVLFNAGAGKEGVFHKSPLQDFEDVIETNLMSNVVLMHALLQNALPNKTKFTFVSSLASYYPLKANVNYSVSKTGLSYFHHGLHIEYPHLPLLCVEIGAVKTPIHEKSGMHISKMKFKSVEKIGKRLFEVMQTKTGVTSLTVDWYVLRKLNYALHDLKIPLLKRITKKK